MENGVVRLYKGRKLIDNNVLNFHYSRFHFYILSEKNKYIVYKYSNKILEVSMEEIEVHDKKIFSNLQSTLLEEMLLEEKHYGILIEKLRESIKDKQ